MVGASFGKNVVTFVNAILFHVKIVKFCCKQNNCAAKFKLISIVTHDGRGNKNGECQGLYKGKSNSHS